MFLLGERDFNIFVDPGTTFQSTNQIYSLCQV